MAGTNNHAGAVGITVSMALAGMMAMIRREFIKTAGVLAGIADYRPVLEQHRKYLAEWCRTTDDRFAVPGDSR